MINEIHTMMPATFLWYHVLNANEYITQLGPYTHHLQGTCWRSPHYSHCSWERSHQSTGQSWRHAGRVATRTTPVCHQPSASRRPPPPPADSGWAAAVLWCCWNNSVSAQWSSQSAPGSGAHSGRNAALPVARGSMSVLWLILSHTLWHTL